MAKRLRKSKAGGSKRKKKAAAKKPARKKSARKKSGKKVAVRKKKNGGGAAQPDRNPMSTTRSLPTEDFASLDGGLDPKVRAVNDCFNKFLQAPDNDDMNQHFSSASIPAFLSSVCNCLEKKGYTFDINALAGPCLGVKVSQARTKIYQKSKRK